MRYTPTWPACEPDNDGAGRPSSRSAGTRDHTQDFTELIIASLPCPPPGPPPPPPGQRVRILPRRPPTARTLLPPFPRLFADVHHRAGGGVAAHPQRRQGGERFR